MLISFRDQFRQQRARVLLGGVVALLALRLGFGTFSPRTAVLIVQHCGYAVMLTVFALFMGLLGSLVSWREVFHRFHSGGWKIVLLIVGLSMFLHIQENHGFKVVNDELIQLSTSQRMHFEREANEVGRAYELGTNFVLMQGEMDKRPLFFPFLVSLVHDLTGYRPENVFVLNALLTPALFGLLYLVVSRVRGRAAGIAAVLLFATVPLVTQVATGGGFELLNLVMILTTLYLGLEYAVKPTETTLGAFCISGILLAQVRYESVLFILPVIGVMVYVTWRSGRLLLPWAVLLAPLLLISYPLQFNIFKLHPGLWQMSDRPSEHGVYSFSYFYDNVAKAMRYFFEWDHSQSNSHLVALCGIVGIGFFWMWLYRRYRELSAAPEQMVYVVFIVALFAQAGLMLCYFWGAYDEVLTVRLSLPTQLLFVLVFGFIYTELAPKAWAWQAFMVLSLFYLCLWTLPTLTRRAYAHENLAAEIRNWEREYLVGRKDRNFFVVEPNGPMLWLAYGVPSLNYDALAIRASGFLYHYEQKTFDDCFVIQGLMVADFATGRLKPSPGCDFGPAMVLDPVRELRLTPTYIIRMSRIVSIDQKAFIKWADATKAAWGSPVASRPRSGDQERKQHEAEYTAEWLRNLP